jgi:hypothetical protein
MNNHRIQRAVPREEVEQLVSDFESSGLTQREFARQRALKLTTFQYWLYRRAKAKAPAPPLVEIKMQPLSAATTHYRLELPGGKVLSFSGPVRLEEIQQLCQVLRD